MRLLIRILVNIAAIWVAAYFVPGLQLSGGLVNLLVIAVIFGLVNALVRPVVKLLTLPLNVLTLGLFTFVVNALMLLLTSWLSSSMVIAGGPLGKFVTALIAGIVISIVSTVINWFLPD